MFALHYQMIAKEGAGDALHAALTAVAAGLQKLPGFEAAELMRDNEAPQRLLFVEKWTSSQAHAAAGALAPKEALSRVMALLATRPARTTYEIMPTG